MNRKNRLAHSVNYLAEKRRKDLDLREASETVVPYAYCTMVMALCEMTDLDHESIEQLISRSQQIWDNWEYGLENPIDVCERLTGIRLMNHEEAKEKGYE